MFNLILEVCLRRTWCANIMDCLIIGRKANVCLSSNLGPPKTAARGQRTTLPKKSLSILISTAMWCNLCQLV